MLCAVTRTPQLRQLSPAKSLKMVKLEEVPDEDFSRTQDGPAEGDDDWDTDSGMLDLLR